MYTCSYRIEPLVGCIYSRVDFALAVDCSYIYCVKEYSETVAHRADIP